jgi:hypothetical protein
MPSVEVIADGVPLWVKLASAEGIISESTKMLENGDVAAAEFLLRSYFGEPEAKPSWNQRQYLARGTDWVAVLLTPHELEGPSTMDLSTGTGLPRFHRDDRFER